MSDYAHPHSSVNTQWVVEHLDDSTIRLVEVIWGDSGEWGTVYAAGHIPGAVAWDFTSNVLVYASSPRGWNVQACRNPRLVRADAVARLPPRARIRPLLGGVG